MFWAENELFCVWIGTNYIRKKKKHGTICKKKLDNKLETNTFHKQGFFLLILITFYIKQKIEQLIRDKGNEIVNLYSAFRN
jgi:hypothetical protein